MSQLNDLIDQLDGLEEAWLNTAGSVEVSAWKKASAIVKDLDIDADGHIVKNVANLRKLGKIKATVKDAMYNKEFQKGADDLDEGIVAITKTHTEYFESIAGGSLGMSMVNEFEKQARTVIMESMSKNGVVNEVSTQIADLIENDVRAGRSFGELQSNVKEIIMGAGDESGRLVANTHQLVADSLHQYAATLNKEFTDQLGLEWYQYVGGTIKSTRPFCRALYRKRFIHRSEFGAVASGNINGVQVSRGGMIQPTNAQNLQINRGGYNCRHQLYAVPKEAVPKRYRMNFGG